MRHQIPSAQHDVHDKCNNRCKWYPTHFISLFLCFMGHITRERYSPYDIGRNPFFGFVHVESY